MWLKVGRQRAVPGCTRCGNDLITTPLPWSGLALVAKKRVGATARAPAPSGHGRDAVDEGEGLGDVVDVPRCGDDFERGAESVADQVVFAARLPPVDRRRAGVGSPFFARMWAPSTQARDQSSSPAVLSSASRMRCSWSKTPACCQRSRRRQHVCPEPNPSSKGRSCQAVVVEHVQDALQTQPVRYRLRARRLSGRGGGSSGPISAHKSSSTIHGRVLTPSRKAESSHRLRRTRALEQDRVTSSTDDLDVMSPDG